MSAKAHDSAECANRLLAWTLCLKPCEWLLVPYFTMYRGRGEPRGIDLAERSAEIARTNSAVNPHCSWRFVATSPSHVASPPAEGPSQP